jgi:hypothetical protein
MGAPAFIGLEWHVCNQIFARLVLDLGLLSGHDHPEECVGPTASAGDKQVKTALETHAHSDMIRTRGR